MLAARSSRDSLQMEDFEEAKDKVSMGVARSSMVVPLRERRRTAYHEAGHAIVARMLPEADGVHKVTIVPRGRALGVTMMLPEEDRLSATAQQLVARLAVAMGGRAAEIIAFDEISTGASNDLQQATRIARAMVTEYGMSPAVGPMSVASGNEPFLGRDLGRTGTSLSEATSRLIDEEIKRFLYEADALAIGILRANLHILEGMAELLLEKETVGGVEFEALVSGLVPVQFPASPA